MLIEKTDYTTTYEEYLHQGGYFTQEDYSLVKDLMSVEDCKCRRNSFMSQIVTIATHCNIPITKNELFIYDVLREKMPPEREISKEENTLHIWEMSDQVLAREIFLLTEETGSKYQTVTEKYPHIFV